MIVPMNGRKPNRTVERDGQNPDNRTSRRRGTLIPALDDGTTEQT